METTQSLTILQEDFLAAAKELKTLHHGKIVQHLKNQYPEKYADRYINGWRTLKSLERRGLL